MGIYRTSHQVTNKDMYFVSKCGKLIHTDHILGSEGSFHKFRIIDIIKSMFIATVQLTQKSITKKAKQKKIMYIQKIRNN